MGERAPPGGLPGDGSAARCWRGGEWGGVSRRPGGRGGGVGWGRRGGGGEGAGVCPGGRGGVCVCVGGWGDVPGVWAGARGLRDSVERCGDSASGPHAGIAPPCPGAWPAWPLASAAPRLPGLPFRPCAGALVSWRDGDHRLPCLPSPRPYSAHGGLLESPGPGPPRWCQGGKRGLGCRGIGQRLATRTTGAWGWGVVRGWGGGWWGGEGCGGWGGGWRGVE